MLALNGQLICQPCAQTRANQAKAERFNIKFTRVIDPTICAKCNTDYGNSEQPLIGGTPICANCSQGLYARPFPAWLRFSLAGLLLILVLDLWRGVPYFRAGRHLV